MKPVCPPDQSSGIATFAESLPLIHHDPNAFIAYLFSDLKAGKPFEQAAVHRELQVFLNAHARALVELPRDHGKTTQILGRILWELGGNPRLRVKVVCATDAIAIQRGQFLREQIESNLRLKHIFPNLKPGRPWSGEAFAVARAPGVVGPSVAAFGIGAGATGTRADLLVCDDVVDVKAILGTAERRRAKIDFENNLLNLLEPTGRFWGLYTPWHSDDLNAHLKKNPAYAVFRRAIDEHLTPVWPGKWSRDTLEARRAEIGEAAFARGYRLLPVAEEDITIRPEWLKTWRAPAPHFETIIMAVDPAVSTQTTADATALVVVGKAAGVAYCLAANAYRVKMPELVPILQTMDDLWKPETIVFESNGPFKGVADFLTTNTDFGHKIRPQSSVGSKASRLEVLAVRIERGEFLLKGTETGEVDPCQKALFTELTSFPFGDHDDLADAAALGTQVLLSQREIRVIV